MSIAKKKKKDNNRGEKNASNLLKVKKKKMKKPWTVGVGLWLSFNIEVGRINRFTILTLTRAVSLV